jgi:hypothetical protein
VSLIHLTRELFTRQNEISFWSIIMLTKAEMEAKFNTFMKIKSFEE